MRAPGAGLEGALAGVGDVVEEGDCQEGDDGERHYGDHWSASFPPGAALAVRGPSELLALAWWSRGTIFSMGLASQWSIATSLRSGQVLWFLMSWLTHRPCHAEWRLKRRESAIRTVEKPLRKPSPPPESPFESLRGC